MKKNKLPEWFDGEVYESGDKVRNPFSGDEYILNAEETINVRFYYRWSNGVRDGYEKPKNDK